MRVPDESEGMSLSCPRCADSFTLARMENPPEYSDRQLRPPPTAAVAAASVLTAVKERDEPEPDSPAPIKPLVETWRRPRLFPYELIGGVALVLAGGAAATAPIPGCQLISVACGGGAIVIGVTGWVLAAKPERGGRVRPAIAVVLGAVIALISAVWPGFVSWGPPLGDNTPRPFGRNPPEVKVSDENETFDIRGTIRAGTVRVRLVSAVAGPVQFVGDAAPDPSQRGLQIKIHVMNGSPERSLNYFSWSRPLAGDHSTMALLRDSTGKAYQQRTFPPNRQVAGQVKELSLGHGGQTDDLLVFDVPANAGDNFGLELPLSAVGGTGILRLEIAGSTIIVR
jgi:hypothetical protein